MINCFTYTYKTLARRGYEFPREFEGYSLDDLKSIIKDYEYLLENNMHKQYYETFCDVVDSAKENDIVVTNEGSIGVAVNEFKFITILEGKNNRTLENISDCTVYRIRKNDIIIQEEIKAEEE